jgi:superfamily II DNA or RNA helicase
MYIYIRCHYAYDVYNACKLGKTLNIIERDSTYATGEIVRGEFKLVFKVVDVEAELKKHFRDLNINHGAGTEFFDKKIINLIEPWLIANGHEYEIVDAADMIRKAIILQKIIIKANKKILTKIIEAFDSLPPPLPLMPRPYQYEIINLSMTHFTNNDKGILVLTCGVGKTLISLWVAKQLNCRKILIGVPNILLLNQWEAEVKRIFDIPVFKVFGVINGATIETFLLESCIILTTYKSAQKIIKPTKKKFTFDITILDEAHHVTGPDDEKDRKTYIRILEIPSLKQLALTATLKNMDKKDNKIIANNSESYFGTRIDTKTLLWAIENNVVCDYIVHTIVKTPNKIDGKKSLAAYAAVESIKKGYSHHLLIYANSLANSKDIIKQVKVYDNSIYASSYSGDMKREIQEDIINNFKKARFGIISCVYCLGEGWDFPILDGVVFAENMTSRIRIVQSTLRACRKDINDPGKKMKIIIPVLSSNWLDENSNDFKNARDIICQMGTEDKTIIEKLRVYTSNNTKFRDRKTTTPDTKLTEDLRLYTMTRLAAGTTYEKARKIIADHKLRSKEEYYKLCETDVRLHRNPEEVYGGNFTNWVDYLNIPRTYYTLDECKRRIARGDVKINMLDLNATCIALCERDPMFPSSELWVDYYKVDLCEIITRVSLNNIRTKGAVR